MFIKTFSDFSLSKAGVLSGANLGTHFKLDNDVSQLFPYINATVEDAKFYNKPEYIQFTIDGILCTLYPNEVIAAPFTNQSQALKFARRLIDFLNDLYAQKDALKPSYKIFRRPVSIIDIYKILPQTNCKECGFATCMAFAAALSKGGTTPDQCPDFSKPISESATYPVFDNKGSLKTTISIEIDSGKRDFDLEKEKKHIEKIERKLIDFERKQKVLVEYNQNEIQTNLTNREIEVLRLITKGATNTQIAETLSISPHTVKSHVIHIFNKLGVNDRTQAAVWATRHKIV